MSGSDFRGFPPEGLKFLRGLKKNNDREWFQARKDIFESSVKEPMVGLVTAVMREMLKFAPDYIGDPKKAIFRIYRDTRFSNNKTPYKTNIAASFHRRGVEKPGGAAFYVSISPKEIEVGGGVYMPTPEQLFAIRNHIAAHHERFRKIIGARSVRSLLSDLHGEQLTRAPKGFPPDHPAEDLIRMKQFLLFKGLDSSLATSPKFSSEVVKYFRVMTPFIEFLSAPLVGRRKESDYFSEGA